MLLRSGGGSWGPLHSCIKIGLVLVPLWSRYRAHSSLVPSTADAANLRLRANSGEGEDGDGEMAATVGVPEPNGSSGGGGAMTASVCLPRAVAPDIVPVILAFLYTDRLVQQPDFGHDGFAVEYVDPGVEGDLSVPAPAVGTERCRPRGRSSFGGDSREAGSISGADWDRENGVPSKVGTNDRE